MIGLDNAGLERFLILIVVLTILVLLVHAVFINGRKALAPQVPPTVSPLLHPMDEDVRNLRHFRANVEQKLPDLEGRVVRQGDQLVSIERGIAEIKQATEKTERMVQVLIEAGLRRERQE